MNTKIDLLKAQLNREIEAAHIFLTSLDNETSVLVGSIDPDALADATQAKWLRANALNAAYQERLALLGTLGYKGMDEAVASNPEVQYLWLELEPALEHCREKNAANGVMIREFTKRTDDALAMLRSASGGQDVYTAKGRTATRGSLISVSS